MHRNDRPNFIFRWSSKLKAGTLQTAGDIDNCIEKEQVVVSDDDEIPDGDEENSQYTSDLQAESFELVRELNVDQWVAVWYNDKWYP